MGPYVRTSVMRKAGIRVPTGPKDAWTAAEMTGILRKLRTQGYKAPLDLRLVYSRPGQEWNTYGFAPAVWSAGGDLVEPRNFRTADGYVNGPGSVKALTALQNWAKAGLIGMVKDDEAFVSGRSAISWSGHWTYPEFNKAFPGDVATVPLPDFCQGTVTFCQGTVTGMGSFQWGVPAGNADGEAVWRFLSFLLQPAQVHRMTVANGAIPATESAVKLSPRYPPGGSGHLFIEQLRDGVARPRPQTPAYPASPTPSPAPSRRSPSTGRRSGRPSTRPRRGSTRTSRRMPGIRRTRREGAYRAASEPCAVRLVRSRREPGRSHPASLARRVPRPCRNASREPGKSCPVRPSKRVPRGRRKRLPRT
ncbi:extracellular solute-binding protein [Streptomyces sp. SAS_260]|uniref:extracellular solute-binding protein n=1 Tax=Streptomyces sp. SAS_260 TaxID=3412751 RepID=UPI00403CF88E